MKEEISGNIDISFVVGEAYQFCIEFEGEIANTITKVYINCSKLNFSKELKQDTDNSLRWYCNFTSEETSTYNPANTTYTLVIYNNIEETNPLKMINNRIIVKEDKNEVVE